MIRNTPLLWPLLAYASGLVFPYSLPFSILCLLLVVSFVGVWVNLPRIRLVSLLLFFSFGGMLRKPIPPPPPQIQNTLLITCSLYPEETTKSWRIKGDIQSQYSNTLGWTPAASKVLIYLDKRTPVDLVPGRSYVVRGKPQLIQAPRRPSDFDFRTYMIRQGIFHQMWVRADHIREVNLPIKPSLRLWLLSRARMVGQIYHQHIPNKEAADVTEAMITGRRDHLSDELNNQYTAAGAVHILAVSGMHISLVYGLLTLLFRGQVLLWPRSWGKPKFIISILVLTLYAGFTGMSASVMRATVMFYLLIVGQWFQRHVSSENVLYGTALILLYIVPIWIHDIGFQLSFLAVWGILTFYPRCRAWWKPENPMIRWLWDLTSLGLSAQLFTFPITLYYFHQFPTYFYVTNVVTALLASALVPLGLALWFFNEGPFSWLVDVLASVTSICAEGLNFLNGEIANLPYAVVHGFSLALWEVALWYGILVLVLWGENIIPRKWILWLAMCLVSILWMYAIRKDWVQENIQRIEHWEIAKQKVWIKMQGKQAVCITKEPLSEANKRFSLKNYWAEMGVHEIKYISEPIN